MKNPVFQNEYYYHIINRGVDKRKVFLREDDYVRFLMGLRYFNSVIPIEGIKYAKNPTSDIGKLPDVGRRILVDLFAYCLNPNHFHLLLMQKVDGGIAEFMKRIGGYTKYFNIKYSRSGVLFQGKYKAFEIKDTDKLLEKSLYVNGNAEIHGIAKCDIWEWSSCLDYLGERQGTLINKLPMSDVGKIEYKKLLFTYIREQKAWKKELKELEPI